ncbi:hypothetical protein [Bordetella genomosp. 13]|uniref:Amino acid transporter n=1 Tax=Bordetella genomosp. 13 TaxID=463040 RepID=A0A1W6ZGI1_9BORD|nr:hypothetical protein [Bordetella genomosp. 13]ARP96365.1 hypothetical protein CAL15_19505 [Bordetella genomosp. 13]
MEAVLDATQWVAMAVTIVAAYLVASRTRIRRHAGFWIFVVSNVLWIIWGIYAAAYALVVLQLFLGVTNVRGLWKTRAAAATT